MALRSRVYHRAAVPTPRGMVIAASEGMFVGHFAVGMAAKRWAPAASLGTLSVAALLPDLLFTGFLATGLEHVRIVHGITDASPLDLYDYPYSHSLLCLFACAALAGTAHFLVRRNARVAWLIGLCVASHWFLDFVSHRPDLPLWPSSEARLGLGLWYSLPNTLIVEGALLVIGAAIYSSCTRTARAWGRVGFWVYTLLLGIALVASLFGPPPPSVRALIIGNVSSTLLILWAFWLDRHRAPKMTRVLSYPSKGILFREQRARSDRHASDTRTS